MALAALIVKIGADTTGLNKGLAAADRNVERFGKKMASTGRAVERMGSAATMAVGSLSRLGSVMPGVSANTATMVASLGAASVVLGETAVLSAGLTKGWRMLTAASTALAASGAPMWLASLASPAGLAVAAVAALAAATYGLKKAWDSATASGKRMGEVLERYKKDVGGIDNADALKSQTARLQADYDAVTAALTKERSKKRESVHMYGVGMIETAGPNEAVVKRLTASQKLLADQMLAVGVQLQKVMADAAKDAEKKWADAAKSAKEKWKDFQQSLRDITGPMGELGRASLVGATDRDFAAATIGRALDPARLAEDLANVVGRDNPLLNPGIQPDKEKERRGLIAALKGSEDARLSESVGGMLGGAAGGMVQAFASFGPMAAILPVISGALEALEPVLETLIEPLVELGRIVGEALAPIFKMLAPVIQLIADMLARQLAPVLKVFVFGLSLTMEALGWLVRGLGKLVDALPGVSAKGVINAGQEMIDAARAARKNTSATENATNAVNEFAAALTNIPRVLNINALRHLISGGSRRPTPTSDDGNSGPGWKPFGGGGLKAVDSSSNVTINVYGATDPIRTAEVVADVLDRRRLRGGTHRLTVATA